MKTEPNTKNVKKKQINDVFFNDEFIAYINTLSDSIKEFHKVSKNVNKNKKLLISLAEEEVLLSESYLNKLKEEINYEDINSLSGIIEKLKDIFNKLQLNVISEEKNLIYFFGDAQILFKKMKEKRQELIMKLKKRSNSTSKNNSVLPFSSSHNNADITFTKMQSGGSDYYNHSEFDYSIKNIKTNESNSRYNNTNNNMNSNKRTIDDRARKSKTLNKDRESTNTNDEYCDNSENNRKSYVSNSKLPENKIIDVKSQNVEIEKLKILNKKLCLELKKCKNKHLETRNNVFENTLKNETNNINIIIQDKEKIISGLKEDINKKNKKCIELIETLNKYKKEMEKTKEENNKLKNINNNNQNIDKNLKIKLNSLIKENSILKNNIEELKLNNYNSTRSEYNSKLSIKKDLDFDGNNIDSSIEKENELLKKKLNIIEKNLSENQLQNKELNNEINKLNNKYETQISQLSKKNSELLVNLKNKQNELLNLKKEYMIKYKELENLKIKLNNMKNNNNNNKNNNNNNNSIENEILEKYKNENEQLKANNSTYQEKIKFYQTEIRNIKNELYDKKQTNIELENDNQNQIKELKDNYEKELSEINNKNINLTNSLEEYKNFNSDLSQQISNLNQQILAKDVKILELKYQIEQLENKIKNKEEENQKLLNKIEKISEDISKNNKKEEIDKLNEKLEEQENLNNDLNEELLKIKNDNELLKNKIMSDEKIINEFKNKENNQYDIKLLNNEIDNLKNENLELKSCNKKLTNQLKEFIDNNKDKDKNNEKDETIKKQKEEIEGLKQLISKIQKEREKGDDDINVLKRENEKIKNQIIRLSQTLPEEYNELQKQYNDLENKYLQEIKNKNSNLSLSGKKSKNDSDSRNTNEDQLAKELKEAKKEIDIIKKKNNQLVEQLEEKEIKKTCYDNKSEDGNKSNYEEEFDLRKMAKGAKEKNRSQDINIDYPGIQAIKEKYRELDFYYNSLEGLVKKLLLTIQTNPKNKTYVTELCKIVGFDLETTNKILTNKNKKLLLGLFSK